MGKWLYSWEIEYYTSGGFLNRKVFSAKSREDALGQLFKSGIRVIEVKCCHRIDTY